MTWESAGRCRAGKVMGWGQRREEQRQEGLTGQVGLADSGNKGRKFPLGKNLRHEEPLPREQANWIIRREEEDHCAERYTRKEGGGGNLGEACEPKL